jgi:hypothetical protein
MQDSSWWAERVSASKGRSSMQLWTQFVLVNAGSFLMSWENVSFQRNVVHAVVNQFVLVNAGCFLISWESVSFPRRIVHAIVNQLGQVPCMYCRRCLDVPQNTARTFHCNIFVSSYSPCRYNLALLFTCMLAPLTPIAYVCLWHLIYLIGGVLNPEMRS